MALVKPKNGQVSLGKNFFSLAVKFPEAEGPSI
jgi:hypothetical protein